jgi:hypothetical protein
MEVRVISNHFIIIIIIIKLKKKKSKSWKSKADFPIAMKHDLPQRFFISVFLKLLVQSNFLQFFFSLRI